MVLSYQLEFLICYLRRVYYRLVSLIDHGPSCISVRQPHQARAGQGRGCQDQVCQEWSPPPRVTSSNDVFRSLVAAAGEEYSCEFGSAKFYALCAVGGALSCGLTHTAVTPLDLVKCRLQVCFEWGKKDVSYCSF